MPLQKVKGTLKISRHFQQAVRRGQDGLVHPHDGLERHAGSSTT